MGKGFDQYASEYDVWFLENPNVLMSEALLVARTLEGCRKVMSVGCGSGLFEAILNDRFGISVKNGVEPSEPMAAIARSRGMDVEISTAEEYDYPAGVYDTFLFNGSPSYITDLEAVVRKVYDALPSGGRIVLIDVPKESSYGLMYNLAKSVGSWKHPLLEGVYPPNPYPIEFVNVANWRTTAEKLRLLEKAGFNDIKSMQTLTAHPLYSDLHCEEPSEGHDRGDYVAVIGVKP